MSKTVVQLDLYALSEADDEELVEATRRLQDELLNLDIERLDLGRSEPAPDGTKAVDAVTAGQLVATLAASGGALATLIGVIQAWLTRTRTVRTVAVEIDGDRLEVVGASSKDQERLIEAWISRRL